MDSLFSKLTLADVRQDMIRNIVSIRQLLSLFDDLSDDPAAQALAQAVEDETKPQPYRSRTPVIDRPFEDAAWFNAIEWPFRNWRNSRFCDGGFGLWYGSVSVETTVHETVHHWVHGLLADAGFENETVVIEREVYSVACQGALLDFRPCVGDFPELLHPSDYGYCQSVGARIHREGHPGLITPSVRHPQGWNVVIFNPAVLSNPRASCQLTYRLEGTRVRVEKEPGTACMVITVVPR